MHSKPSEENLSGGKNPPTTRRPALAGLLAVALANGLVYAFALVRPANLFELYHIVHFDGKYFEQGGHELNMRLLVTFTLLLGLYLAGWWFLRGAPRRAAWVIVLGGVGAYALILLALAPFDASDIYDNIIHSRITGVYGQNPFVQVPDDFPKDPFTPYAAWTSSPSAYGPAWEVPASLAARLAGEGIVENVLAFKLLPGVFMLGSLGLVILILRRHHPEFALPGALLLGWNPMVLFATWGNGHNDLMMVFFILAASWALLNRRFTLAILALVLGGLVKYLPVLLLPAAGLIALREIPTVQARLRFGLLTGLLAAGLIWIAWRPFWEGAQVLTVERRSEMLTTSLSSILHYTVGMKLGKEISFTVISILSAGLTGLFALWQGWRARKDLSWQAFPRAAFLTLAFYLLVTVPWFQAWYTQWLVGLAPLLLDIALVRLAVIFSFSAFAKALVFIPIVFGGPKPDLPQPWLEIILSAGVMAVPWAYALYHWLSGLSVNHDIIRGKTLTDKTH